ncbi:GNAT family N-acetyltransferase [Jatrophihabitans sp.]|uniref:GNAT family N-acetyltransferase n=1 Tax=Jatrophihabitans sp. TaxID=1932789 RepID=UPI002B8C7043|nr:GNAT family N-acetyltransferase [Jatrophihabitans sp.]
MTVIQARPRVLAAADELAVRSLVQRDRVLNCVVDCRLQRAPDLNPQRLGGYLWGVGEAGDELRAAAFCGGNLVPVGEDLAALELIAGQLARGGRSCSSIVGAAESVATMWPVLSRRWGPARAIRASQPLLATQAVPGIEPDPRVRRVRPADLPRFLPAAVSMFTEELGVSPIGPDAGRGYRARVAELIEAGRAFARFDEQGQVEFKAEIGVLGRATAQLQGVWVRPDRRRQGIATAAMAAVLGYALELAPSVSLYVNDYNIAGRRLYDRLGMRQVSTLSTVLF